MKEIYKSKIGTGIAVPIAVILSAVFIVMIILGAISGILILVFVMAFFGYMFSTTDYTIDGSELKVRCGFMINTTIDINSITKIENTNSILSAPALSFDRIEIFYNKYDSVVISPNDKAGFIARLKEINGGISVG